VAAREAAEIEATVAEMEAVAARGTDAEVRRVALDAGEWRVASQAAAAGDDAGEGEGDVADGASAGGASGDARGSGAGALGDGGGGSGDGAGAECVLARETRRRRRECDAAECEARELRQRAAESYTFLARAISYYGGAARRGRRDEQARARGAAAAARARAADLMGSRSWGLSRVRSAPPVVPTFKAKTIACINAIKAGKKERKTSNLSQTTCWRPTAGSRVAHRRGARS